MLRAEPYVAIAQKPLLASCFALMLLSLTAVAANGNPFDTAQNLDCDAVNNGALNIGLGGFTRATRRVTLRADETLDIAVKADADAFGSLTLVAGKGSPRPLLAGPTGTTVRFVAPARDTFGFEFVAEGEADVAFTATCSRAQSARRNGLSAAAKLLAEKPNLRSLPEPELPASIDPEVWDLFQESQPTAANPSVVRRRPATASLRVIRPPNGLDLWLQANGNRYSLGEQQKAPLDSDATDLSGGGLKFKVLPEIMIGALVNFDQQGEQLIKAPLSLSDRGWMAGPMATVQLVPGISLDARAAWGESRPAAPFSAASGLGAERRLVNARLANTQTFGHWRFSPSVVVNYVEEEQHSVGLSTEGGPARQTFGSGRVDIRPELSYRLDLGDSTFIEPKAAISSFWDIDSLLRLAPGSSEQDMRIKAEAGVTIGTITGTKLQATGGVEEGGAGAEDIWSGRFQLSVPLK